jgi:DNA-binding response OmpR family regulator
VTEGRILVVDDDPMLRSSVARILEDEGYTVDHATDGLDALARISERRPDAILLDVLMPRMNGKQLLAALRGDASTAEIPVVVMTTVTGIEGPQTLGASDYVEKPFDVDELLNKLALALYRAHSEAETAPTPRPVPARPTAPAHQRGTGVVLVVDDDRGVLEAFEKILAAQGYMAVCLSRATEELPRLARVLEPAAILIDLRLPDVDGLTVLRWLRAERKLDGVPILMFSGSSGELEEVRAEIEALRAESLPKTEAVERVLEFVSGAAAT